MLVTLSRARVTWRKMQSLKRLNYLQLMTSIHMNKILTTLCDSLVSLDLESEEVFLYSLSAVLYLHTSLLLEKRDSLMTSGAIQA